MILFLIAPRQVLSVLFLTAHCSASFLHSSPKTATCELGLVGGRAMRYRRRNETEHASRNDFMVSTYQQYSNSSRSAQAQQ